jgi:hypothetical protein
MKYVPSLPPVSGVENRREVHALSAVKPVKRVQPRTLPPLVIQPHASHQKAAAESTRENEKREAAQESRRKYCRRVSHQPMLEELRSGLERRRHQQRGSDDTEHINEEV